MNGLFHQNRQGTAQRGQGAERPLMRGGRA
jgi:hypothetical protein